MITPIAVLVLSLTSKIQATPTVSLPVNSQVPPVANVATPFQFTFSASTFSSPDPDIHYFISNNPSWLHLDGTSRTISGLPDSSNIGPFNFSLTATDGTGSVSSTVTLIVSDRPEPGLGTPVSQQLPAFGTFSSPHNLLLYPSASLSISFRPDTFTNTNQETIYYALCANNTPLPSWITFDPKGLSFKGTTPEFTSPEELPQVFGIDLIASNVIGFSGAGASFQIIIESHKLTFGNHNFKIEVLPGKPFTYSGLQAALTLDGVPAQPGKLKWITGVIPQWMSFDTHTLEISGTPPPSVVSQNFSIVALDIYGDKTRQLPTLNAVIGSTFNYTLNSSFFPESGTRISAELGNTSSWLTFDSSTLTLSGSVPKGLGSQQDELDIVANQGTQSQTQTLTIVLSQPKTTDGMIASSITRSSVLTTHTLASSPTTQPTQANTDKDRSRNKLVAAAVVIPLVAILGFGLLLYWCISAAKRRRRGRSRGDSVVRAIHISRPFFWDRFANMEPRTGTSEKRPLRHNRIPSHAPEIENIRPHSARLPEFTLLNEDEVSLRQPDMVYKPRGRRMSMKRSIRVAARSPKRGFSRQSKRYSRMSLASSNGILPNLISGVGHGGGMNEAWTSNRLSLLPRRRSDLGSGRGIGHGKESFNFGTTGFDKVANSWRNAHSDSTHSSDYVTTTDTKPSNEDRCNTLSSTLSRFPPPASYTPRGSRILHGSINGHSKRSSRYLPDTIRLVDDSGSDRRLSYFKQRSRFPAPLFSAGPSSRKSSQYSTAKNPLGMHLDTYIAEQADEKGWHDIARAESQRSFAPPHSIRPQSSGREKKSPSFFPRKWAQTTLRVKPSTSSLASSRHFESANESEAPSEHGGTDLIAEEGDDETWPHGEHTEILNPLALHRVSTGERMKMAMEGEGITLGEGRQRPVSIEKHSGLIRGRPVSKSMRGDLAFV